MPREQLVNLSPDKRHHLDLYLSAKADAAKYKAEAARYEAEAAHLDRVLDATQTGLAVAGAVPVIGAAPDLVNTGVSLARRDYAGAALNATAVVPGPIGGVAGVASTGRLANRAARITEESAGGVSTASEVGRASARLDRSQTAALKIDDAPAAQIASLPERRGNRLVLNQGNLPICHPFKCMADWQIGMS